MVPVSLQLWKGLLKLGQCKVVGRQPLQIIKRILFLHYSCKERTDKIRLIYILRVIDLDSKTRLLLTERGKAKKERILFSFF